MRMYILTVGITLNDLQVNLYFFSSLLYSIGGHKLPESSMPGFNFYCGTKFMVRALAEGLRQEVMAENTAENLIRVAVSLLEQLKVFLIISFIVTTTQFYLKQYFYLNVKKERPGVKLFCKRIPFF